MPITHPFKPYADCPDLCVAELPNGETCNEYRSTHTLDDVLAAVAKIRGVQADRERWIAEVTDDDGDPEIDDEDWIDGLAEYDDDLANAGLELADAVENFIKY